MGNQIVAQTERLRKHLESGQAINPLQAWADLGIYRLSARVYDLKQAGVDVRGRLVQVSNRHGEEFRVKEYWIGGGSA